MFSATVETQVQNAATVLLNAAGYSLDNIHTITYGATGLEVRYAFLGTTTL